MWPGRQLSRGRHRPGPRPSPARLSRRPRLGPADIARLPGRPAAYPGQESQAPPVQRGRPPRALV